jgi:mannosyl-oligosaccharide glucosidase
LHDTGNNIDLTTTFVKIPDAGNDGGNWAVRIHGKPQADENRDLKTTVMFTIASPASGLVGLEVQGDEDVLQDPAGITGDITIKGQNPTLGVYKLVVTEGKGSHPQHGHPSAGERPLDRTFISSTRLPEESLWRSKSMFNRCFQRSNH